jgi:hypothetical protein
MQSICCSHTTSCVSKYLEHNLMNTRGTSQGNKLKESTMAVLCTVRVRHQQAHDLCNSRRVSVAWGATVCRSAASPVACWTLASGSSTITTSLIYRTGGRSSMCDQPVVPSRSMTAPNMSAGSDAQVDGQIHEMGAKHFSGIRAPQKQLALPAPPLLKPIPCCCYVYCCPSSHTWSNPGTLSMTAAAHAPWKGARLGLNAADSMKAPVYTPPPCVMTDTAEGDWV